MGPIAVGDRLPNVELPEAGSGTPRPLRGPHRNAVVVVALHDPDCRDCAAYLERLAAEEERFRIWDGTVITVSAREPSNARSGPDTYPGWLLMDREGDILAGITTDKASGPGRAGPRLLVADRYGQLFRAYEGGAEHGLPGPRELEEWLRYLATQCPE